MAFQITRRSACLLLGATVASTAFALPVQADESDPENFMRGLAGDAIAILRDRSLDAAGRTRALRILLRHGFDLPAVSRFVLGRYWRKANAAERSEFVQLFEDYVVTVYGSRFGQYGGEVLTIVGQRDAGDTDAIVHSELRTDGAPPIKLDWRLKRRPQGWRVVDIMVEGVSLALAQRSEFASVIRNSGGEVSGLLEKLRKKTQTVALNQQTDAEEQESVRAQ